MVLPYEILIPILSIIDAQHDYYLQDISVFRLMFTFKSLVSKRLRLLMKIGSL